MITLLSPAKVNLFLRVVGRRPDGYHELASLFQTVNLCDTLQFELADKDELICDVPGVPADHSNLILKAIELFRRKTGKEFGVKVVLDKKIPPQSGLGGGSSNAATTLWALNQLNGEPASVGELQSWGAEIGSDVPFFLSQGTAYCTGRGEKVRNLDPLPKVSMCLVQPGQGLPTPMIYQRLNLDELSSRDPENALGEFLQGSEDYFNDLEEPAFALLPRLALLKQSILEQGFEHVMMTGSGSALFCVGDRVPKVGGDVRHYIVEYLNRPESEWYGSSL